ncbi:MAG: cysteine desulfurase family protein [Fimbriimonadales bacterium]
MRIAERYYCDHAATTPPSSGVIAAMQPWLEERFQNPSSMYEGARLARRAIDEARDIVASAIGCHSGEVVFTSSGTEAANLGVLGPAMAGQGGNRNRVILSAGEHLCVLNTTRVLERLGYRVEIAPIGADGGVDCDWLAEKVGDDVLLVAAMSANNETGALSDTAGIGGICRRAGALYFCDAVQSFGLFKMDFAADLVAISGHKIYGPKGVGALMILAGTQCEPMTVGGGQEREMRAGTEFVAGIVGLGQAVALAVSDSDRANRMQIVRDDFVSQLSQVIPEAVITPHSGLPGHAHFRVVGRSAEAMLINLDRLGIDASSGSACSSGSIEPSHVLLAMGWTESEAREALRFSFGAHSKLEDVSPIIEKIKQAVNISGGRLG